MRAAMRQAGGVADAKGTLERKRRAGTKVTRVGVYILAGGWS